MDTTQALSIATPAAIAIAGGWIGTYKLVSRRIERLVMSRANELSALLNSASARNDFAKSSLIAVVNQDNCLGLEGYLRQRGCRKVKTVTDLYAKEFDSANVVILDRVSQSQLDEILREYQRDFIVLTPGRLNMDMSRCQPVNSPRRVWLELTALLDERFDLAQQSNSVSPAEL